MAKQIVDKCLKFDLVWLNQNGFLKSSNIITINWNNADRKNFIEAEINLEEKYIGFHYVIVDPLTEEEKEYDLKFLC